MVEFSPYKGGVVGSSPARCMEMKVWCSWSTSRPVTPEIAGSSPVTFADPQTCGRQIMHSAGKKFLELYLRQGSSLSLKHLVGIQLMLVKVQSAFIWASSNG